MGNALGDPNTYMPAGMQGDLVTPLARTILEGGDVQARAALARGQAMRDMVGGIANAGEQFLQARQQQQQGQAVSQLMAKATTDPSFDLGSALKDAGVNPRDYEHVITAFGQANQAAAMVQERKARAQELTLQAQKAQQELQQSAVDFGATSLYHATRPELAGDDGGLTSVAHALVLAHTRGVPGADEATPIVQQMMAATDAARKSGDPAALAAVAQKNAATLAGLRDQYMSSASEAARAALLKEQTAGYQKLGADERLVDTLHGGRVVAEGGPKPTTPGSEAAYIVGKYGPNPTPQQLLQGRQEYANAGRDPAAAQAHADAVALRQQNHQDTQLQSSYNHASDRIEKIGKPIEDEVQNLARAAQLVEAGTAASDALAPLATIKALVGGQGSGVRITQTEINQVMHGRSGWADIQAAVNKWVPGEALSLTPLQRQQLQSAVQIATQRAQDRAAKVNAAREALDNAPDAQTHHRIVTQLHADLDGTTAKPAAPPPRPPANAPAGGQFMLMVNGQPTYFPSGAALEAFKKAAGVP